MIDTWQKKENMGFPVSIFPAIQFLHGFSMGFSRIFLSPSRLPKGWNDNPPCRTWPSPPARAMAMAEPMRSLAKLQTKTHGLHDLTKWWSFQVCHIFLVVGVEPLWKMMEFVNWDDFFATQYFWENKNGNQSPPTSHLVFHINCWWNRRPRGAPPAGALLGRSALAANGHHKGHPRGVKSPAAASTTWAAGEVVTGW